MDQDYNPIIESEVHVEHGLVRPSKIILTKSNSVSGGFGKFETEVSAGHLVLFMKDCKNDRWESFSIGELVRYYNNKGWDVNKMFDGLIACWVDVTNPIPWFFEPYTWIINLMPGKYCVTRKFIENCSKKTP